MITPELLAEATGPLAPPWEKKEPGRIEWELAWFRYFGVDPEIDEEALASGALWLHFDWPVDGQPVALTAQYPDSYPRMRPRVSIRENRPAHQRHVSPIDGDVCLLGRDTRQWTPDLGLARLLDLQLKDALSGSGDEDPQGEPDEYWWNLLALEHSYILVDSSWNLTGHERGSLDVRCVASFDRLPRVRGWVERIFDADGNEICSWAGPPLLELGGKVPTAKVPWLRLNAALPPSPAVPGLMDLIKTDAVFQKQTGKVLGDRVYGQILAVLYPMESGPGEVTDGWLFPLVWGSPRAFVGRGKRPNVRVNIIGTLRAGAADIGSRVPEFAILRDKDVGIVGAGAIGAPVVIELAKNGCRTIRVLDHDRVEPGNSIRWPLGSSAWAEKKVCVLQKFVDSEYRWSEIRPLDRVIGDVGIGENGDAATLSQFEGVDLLVDASASFGVTTTINDWAREHNVPMISLAATPPVKGGTIAFYSPGGACPTCLEFYQQSGEISPPSGQGDEEALVQPVGCGERTFAGSSINLQEISLQAARVAIEVLSGPPDKSFVQTVALVDDSGNKVPPLWRVDPMPIHPDCPCH